MFIRYPHGSRRTVAVRHIIPNLITTIALCCGLASIHFSLKPDWDRAILCVMLAAVFDALDGRAARLLKASSPFGAVLDSLGDFLSFGVAPAILLHQWLLKGSDQNHDIFGLAAVMTFALCSALRLARFTAAVKPTPKTGPASAPVPLTPDEHRAILLGSKFFVGMPTPAAAAAVLVPPMLIYSKMFGPGVRQFFGVSSDRLDMPASPSSPLIEWTVILYTFLIAYMMVSRLPMFSFKKLRMHRRAVVPLLLVVGLLVGLAVKDIWLMVSVISLGYLCSLPISLWSHRQTMRKPIGNVAPTQETEERREKLRLRKM